MDWKGYLLSNERLINVICSLFTSIGTVGAVIVSLYLSYRSNHPLPKIRAVADFKYFHRDSDSDGTDGIPVIVADIANRSIASIEINSFGWVAGFSSRFIRKKVAYQYPKEILSQLSSHLPTIIPFGQNAQFFIAEDIFLNNIKKLFPVSKYNFLNKLNSYFFYLFIHDSLSNHYYFRVERDLRNKILNTIGLSKKE